MHNYTYRDKLMNDIRLMTFVDTRLFTAQPVWSTSFPILTEQQYFTDKASAASSHDIEQSKDDDKDGEDSADSLSSEVISASDPNSVDNDKSGNSIENSVGKLC